MAKTFKDLVEKSCSDSVIKYSLKQTINYLFNMVLKQKKPITITRDPSRRWKTMR